MKTDIILIGNANSCLEYKLGSVIDSYNKVMRMNNFKTQGFEEYVGTKTDVWIRSDNYDVLEKPESDYKMALIFNCSNSGKFNFGKYIFTWFNAYYSIKKKGIEFPGDPSEWHISLGLTSILWLLEFHSCITYHGFDFFQSGHYWNKDWKHWKGHNGEFEKNLIGRLKDEKRLICLTENLS